ncbi:flagellar hook protein FlgE, partial [Pseudomonas aeruginosa]|nr:flagellar hook protein FlgE [Pseudomonas aeruginosa]
GTLGALQSGALEASNVDISNELVNLIVHQRNYQANAKTIQTEDAVTQTIINLR